MARLLWEFEVLFYTALQFITLNQESQCSILRNCNSSPNCNYVVKMQVNAIIGPIHRIVMQFLLYSAK